MTAVNCEDQELLAAMREGDSAAFHALYSRYWQQVLHFAYQKTNDLMLAEDIVQDIFVSLWQRREELVITSNLRSYLMVSIKYRMIKLLDRQRSIRLQEDLSALDVLDDSTQELLEFDELRSRLENMRWYIVCIKRKT
jgi:RNA polymerase sigma-70 factor (ECF subfamily)